MKSRPKTTITPVEAVEIPKASGWHVAGLQFINPMGTWRMACPHVNQGTRYANVTFRPAPARAGYRADSSLVNTENARYSSAKSNASEVHHVQG